MAQKGIDKAIEQGYLDLHYWAEHVIQRLALNFRRQNIWPYGYPGPYKGYADTPAAKRSTGMGIRSLYAQVYAAAGGDSERITFFFNDYLSYVDMGVGGEQDLEKLRALGKDKDAKKAYRLHAKWKEMGDRQQRPFLMKEFRHQVMRLQAMLWAYYGERTKIVMLRALTPEQTKSMMWLHGDL